MRESILVAAFILILPVEVLAVYLWFTWFYLKKKNMKFSQIKRRTVRLYRVFRRIEKYQVWPRWEFYCFLRDERAVYLEVFVNLFSMLFSSLLLLIVFVVMGIFRQLNLLTLIILSACNFYLWVFLWGKKMGFWVTMDKYIEFLVMFEMSYKEDIDGILTAEISRKNTKKIKKQFLENEMYLKKKYEQYEDIVIQQEDEKWFDKRPFWTMMVVVCIGVGVLYLVNDWRRYQSAVAGERSFASLMEPDKSMIPFLAFFLIWTLVMWLILNRKNKNRFQFIKNFIERVRIAVFGPRDSRVMVHDRLWSLSKEIKGMCVALHISGVTVGITNNAQDIAMTYVDENGVQNVLLDSGQLNMLQEYSRKKSWRTSSDIVLFMIGHELAHVYYKDSHQVRGHVWQLFLLIGFMVFMLLSTKLLQYLAGSNSAVWLLFIIIALLVEIFAISPMMDDRYWNFIKELRADRLSLWTLHLRKETFYRFADYCRKNEMDSADKAHPDMEFRCMEMEKHGAWHWIDYVEYAIRFRINRMTLKKSVF